MLELLFSIIFELIQLISVIILVAYFFIRTKIFQRCLSETGSICDKVLVILVFGGFSIYGNLSGVWLNGSEANVRDLGPVFAGLMFGPVIGIFSSLIGALFRFSLGGVTVIPCTLTTIIAGILSGLIWWLNRKQFIGTIRAVIFILTLEIIHLSLILLLSGTSTDVIAIITTMWAIKVPLSVIGIAIFSIIYEQYAKELRIKENLERQQIEMKSATEIQKGFLPKDMPTISGYEIFASSTPAREVGGDFFDFIPLDNGTYGIVIADVSGKSVPAAIFMGLSCTTVRVFARWVPQAFRLVGQVNSHIVRYSESGMFFSLFYAILEPDCGTITYVNAGHPSPIIIRNSGSIDELKRTGPVVGFMEDEEYEELHVTLEAGDILICYTDGVNEARRSDGEMFGKSRVISYVSDIRKRPIKEINSLLLQEITKFVGEAPQFDDISLLFIKRQIE